MKKSILKNIYAGSYMIIIYNVLGAITWYKHMYLLPLTLVSTYILSYYFLNKNSPYYLKNGMLICLPLTIINIIICISINDFSRGLPYILFVPLSTYLAFLHLKYKKNIIPLLSLVLFGFISFIIFPNYFIYYHNHNAEKNIKFPTMFFKDNQSKVVNFNSDKIIILDFWSTSCGICFEKFPILEDTYKKYKNDKNVEIYSVNVPIRGDKFEKTIKILDSIGYTFPKIYAESLEQIEVNLHFNKFPNLMILKNGRIRYEGVLENKSTSLLYNIEDQIEKLIEE
jgi:thiol-disulfide isomerase/thioredoxin